MSLELLHAAGTITDRGSPSPGLTIVGTTPLADNTDTTYVEWDADYPAHHDLGGFSVRLDPLAGSLTSDPITLHVRQSYGLLATTGFVQPVDVSLSDTPTGASVVGFTAGTGTPIQFVPAPVAAGGAIWDGVEDVNLAGWGATLSDVATLLAGGAYLNFTRVSALSKIYEAWLEVGSTTVPTLYPLRRYPPVNNGGAGPTRHWPRTVNRRAGGTY